MISQWVLPGGLGVTEVDVEVGIYSELGVFGNLSAMVAGQGPAEQFGKARDRRSDRVTSIMHDHSSLLVELRAPPHSQ